MKYAEKYIKAYGTYRKPVTLNKWGNAIDVIVEFYDCGGDKARVYVRSWNGRTWNCVTRASFTKLEANELARKIIRTNTIDIKEFV